MSNNCTTVAKSFITYEVIVDINNDTIKTKIPPVSIKIEHVMFRTIL